MTAKRPLLNRTTLLPFLVACFVGIVWVNQGISTGRVHALHDAPGAHIGVAHNTLLNLYQRAGDEELYFTVAQAIRGLPYDRARLTTRGRDTPEAFQIAPPVDGHWHAPFTEVPIEYPAALLPFVVLPGFVAANDFAIYSRVFAASMAALLIGAAALAIRTQPARSDRSRWWWMAAMILAHGAMAVQRLDAAVAFALAWTLWAAAERKPRMTGIASGVATAMKFVPALLLGPLAAVDRRAWSDERARLRAIAGFALAMLAGFAPMLLVPAALTDVLRYHAARGLHVESTYAVLISAWRMVSGTLVPSVLSYGSYNLDGAAAAFFARISTWITLALIAALTVVSFRAPAPIDETERRDRLALVLLAAMAALWLSGKVFSPQYLTWGMPLVLAVSGKRGRTLTWILFVLYWITQYEMTGDYDNVKDQLPLGVVTLLVRLPLLIAFGVVAVRGLIGNDRETTLASAASPVPEGA